MTTKELTALLILRQKPDAEKPISAKEFELKMWPDTTPAKGYLSKLVKKGWVAKVETGYKTTYSGDYEIWKAMLTKVKRLNPTLEFWFTSFALFSAYKGETEDKNAGLIEKAMCEIFSFDIKKACDDIIETVNGAWEDDPEFDNNESTDEAWSKINVVQSGRGQGKTVVAKLHVKGVYSLTNVEKQWLLQKGHIQKCNCSCHANKNVKHVAPCCDNGYLVFGVPFMIKKK